MTETVESLEKSLSSVVKRIGGLREQCDAIRLNKQKALTDNLDGLMSAATFHSEMDKMNKALYRYEKCIEEWSREVFSLESRIIHLRKTLPKSEPSMNSAVSSTHPSWGAFE